MKGKYALAASATAALATLATVLATLATVLATLATISLVATISLIATGCASIQHDLVVSSTTEADFSSLDEIERLVAEYRGSPDAAKLAQAKAQANAAASRPTLNPAYAARLSGLSGEIALLSGDAVVARAVAEKLLKEARFEELGWLLSAWLAKDAAEARGILQKGRDEAASNARIVAELAELDMKTGAYREALAGYDQALPALSDAWKAYYRPRRDAAFRLKDAGYASARIADQLSSTRIAFIGMVAVADVGVDALAFITDGKPYAADALFDRLLSAGWFAPGTAPSDSVTRKDAALFLWRLYAERKRDLTLTSKYSTRYAAKPGASSPVPDVPLNSPWFDAVLGCVERGIMRLPDGRNFEPDGPVSGSEFFEAVKALVKL